VRVLSITHERDAGSGVFADVARERGDELLEWVPAEGAAPGVEGVEAVLVFGGAMNVDEDGEHGWLYPEKDLLQGFLARRTPMLGVCLGAQLLAEVAGGAAKRATEPEIGWFTAQLTPAGVADALLGQLPARFESFQWHSYEIAAPPAAIELARSATCLQAFRLDSARAWGIQFHAEVTAETIATWVRDYRIDEDAVRADLDWAGIMVETSREIRRWNALGAGLCCRFLDYAATQSARGLER
jgi:GMP synthase (glutamine-hydrolysing)